MRAPAPRFISPCAIRRRVAPIATLALAGMTLAGMLAPAAAEEPPPGAHPKTYALIAALGDQFAVVTEYPSTGTHLSPIRRTQFTVEDDLLNRLALSGLDTAIARLDPDSRRVYMTLRPETLKDVAAPKREEVAFGRIVEALEAMPQRAEWDRVVVLTPTYASTELEGLPGKLQGPGVFVEPLCQGRTGKGPADPDSCKTNSRPPAGPEATAPDGSVTRVNQYAAPFSYVQVWILDAKTLAIIDQQKVFDSQKLFDPNTLMGMPTGEFMAARFTAVVRKSVGKAVDDTVLRGKVETEIREVRPDDGAR